MSLLPLSAFSPHDAPPREPADIVGEGGSVDGSALAAITDLYREFLPAGGAILDIMSSWVGHLPPEVSYRRIVGVGADECTLAENPFLDEWRVQDLNREPRLPFAVGEFDGATICASVQHLSRPSEVLREVGRVLRPGSPLIVTFSTSCSVSKAIACWRLHDEAGHLCLVARYFDDAGNWSDVRCLDRTPRGNSAPLYAVVARSLGDAGMLAND